MTPIPARRRGFSLIELMVVISIIAILSALGFIGFKAIRRSQDQRSTRATMEIGRSMFNAYVNSARSGTNSLTMKSDGQASQFYLKLAPSEWWFNKDNYADGLTVVNIRTLRSSTATLSYANSIDYYNVPRRLGDSADSAPIPMNVPRNISNLPIANTNATDSDQVLYNDWLPTEPTDPSAASNEFADRWPIRNTMLLIRRMRSAPDSKTIWSTLRESQIKHLSYIDPAIKSDAGQDFMVDAWGQPLLFVPGSGLRGLQYGDGPRTATSGVRNGEVKPTLTGSPADQAFRSPDGRGFWMSAGPDGFYDTQDDNLYSFDN